MSTTDIRTFREDVVAADVSGYEVETLDGSIGEIDDATGTSRAIAVLTWISGRKVVLPALVVAGIDHEAKKIYVSATTTGSRTRSRSTPRTVEARIASSSAAMTERTPSVTG